MDIGQKLKMEMIGLQAKVNALQELGPLLSFGHLPLKGKTLLWELSVSRDFGQLIIGNAKSLPFSPLGQVGGVGFARVHANLPFCRVRNVSNQRS